MAENSTGNIEEQYKYYSVNNVWVFSVSFTKIVFSKILIKRYNFFYHLIMKHLLTVTTTTKKKLIDTYFSDPRGISEKRYVGVLIESK